MYTISKRFQFSASHLLNNLEEGHPCSRNHGHNYELTIYLASKELDKQGFVLDYQKLDFVKQYVNKFLDHRCLNDVFDFNPTVENMTKKIYDLFKPKCPQLLAVALSETPNTECIYEP
jgi:6-pyruvoyltetrahydropterin/6-carboxytetrahydropterin synthase